MWSYVGYASLIVFLLLITGVLNPLLYRLFDDTKFRGMELAAIEAWREKLNDHQKSVLDQQMVRLLLVQKGAGGAKVCGYYGDRAGYFFNDRRLPPQFASLVQDPKYKAVLVATVEFVDNEVPDSHPLRARIFLYQRRLFSVEYPKPPKRFAKKHGLKIENMQVKSVIIHASP